ncbi:TPA: hypothetical protein VVP49_001553 [Streptococcus pneumoniae]|nr:hypothetical protein [Streptococcus pneumoniae]HEU5780737.1 hypothetical protein [Streptococcus pneumoniae]
MTTNKDNDTSERSGCQRKRTAGEMPMNDLTSHTHGGNYTRGVCSVAGSILASQ